MAKFRIVRTDFWVDPIVSEEMSPEDRYFMLYLLTNPLTKQIGIYKVTKKQIAFDMGYSIESVAALMNRFIHHHKLIRYNPETRELGIKNWGKNITRFIKVESLLLILSFLNLKKWRISPLLPMLQKA